MNTVLFTEWFDTQNPRHVRAWEYLLKYNQFPVSFEIPEHVVFDPGWFENIRQRLEFMNLHGNATKQRTDAAESEERSG